MNRKDRRAAGKRGQGAAPPRAPSGGPHAAALYAEAIRLHQAGRLAEAAALCREVLAAAPDHVGGLHLLGSIAQQSGRPDQAAEHFRRVIALQPDIAAAHIGLGGALAVQGSIAAAARAFEQALALAPEQPKPAEFARIFLSLANLAKDRRDWARRPRFIGARSPSILRWRRRTTISAPCCSRAASSRPPRRNSRRRWRSPRTVRELWRSARDLVQGQPAVAGGGRARERGLARARASADAVRGRWLGQFGSRSDADGHARIGDGARHRAGTSPDVVAPVVARCARWRMPGALRRSDACVWQRAGAPVLRQRVPLRGVAGRTAQGRAAGNARSWRPRPPARHCVRCNSRRSRATGRFHR